MCVIRKYPLLLFFFLSFFFPWLIWGTTIAENQGWISFHIPQPLAFWIGLNIATIVTALLTGGRSALKDLAYRVIRWRIPPVWYLVAVGFTAVLSLSAIGLFSLTGIQPQFGNLLSSKNLPGSFAFQIIFFLLTEELAWRGFALPRLQARFNPLTASIILGLIWGVWHFPLVFIPGSFQSNVPFIGFILSAVAVSITATWIFNHSKGSVLLAAIFHAATDVTIAYSNVMTGDRRLFWLFVVVQCVAGVFLLTREGFAHHSRAGNWDGLIFLSENNG